MAALVERDDGRMDADAEAPAAGSRQGASVTSWFSTLRIGNHRLAPMVADAVMSMLRAGYSIREVSARCDVDKNTAASYARALKQCGERLRCRCGAIWGHRGWCTARVAVSPKRQALLAYLHERQILPPEIVALRRVLRGIATFARCSVRDREAVVADYRRSKRRASMASRADWSAKWAEEADRGDRRLTVASHESAVIARVDMERALWWLPEEQRGAIEAWSAGGDYDLVEFNRGMARLRDVMEAA
jgi:hypothetical protein